MDRIGRTPGGQVGYFDAGNAGDAARGPERPLYGVRSFPAGLSRPGFLKRFLGATESVLGPLSGVQGPPRCGREGNPAVHEDWVQAAWESRRGAVRESGDVHCPPGGGEAPETGSEGSPKFILNRHKWVHDVPHELTSEISKLKNLTIAERSKVRTAAVVDELFTTANNKVAHQVEQCSTWLLFREWMTGEVRLKDGNFCGQPKLCVWCSRRRAIRMMRQHVGKCLTILAENPGWVPMMVTVTVKDGADLGERMRHLKAGLDTAKMRRKNCLHGKRGRWTEFARIQAAVWHFEVTRGAGSGLWHPHAHGLILRGREDRFDHKAIKAEWLEITGDSKVIQLDLTRAGHAMVEGGLPIDHPEVFPLLIGDLVECFKYPLKFGSMTPADVVHVWEVTKGVRFLQEWGNHFKAAEPTFLGDDLAGLTGAFRDQVYRWMADDRCYRPDDPGDWSDGPGDDSF